MRVGLRVPGIVEGTAVSADEIVKVRWRYVFVLRISIYLDLYGVAAFIEPVRLIFANASHELGCFEDRAGFKSVWPEGNYTETEKRVDGLDKPVRVYRPLVNRWTGQKLRVMLKQPSSYCKFASEEKVILRRESAKYAEANCILLFVGCGGGHGQTWSES